MPNQYAQPDAEAAFTKRQDLWEPAPEPAAGEQGITPGNGRYPMLPVPAAIAWRTGPDGRERSESQQWLEFTGQSLEEIVGLGWADAIHPEDRERTKRFWSEAVEGGRTFELEHRVRRRDGVYRILQARGVPVRDEAGTIVEWAGMHADVTELRNLESKLEQRERELREAQRIAQLGSWSWEVETDTVSWSDVVYQIFELDPGLPPPGFGELRKYHTEESWHRLAEAVAQALERGTAYEVDVEVVVGSGRRKWVAARGEVEAYVGERPARMRGTIQDISDRKARLEAAQMAQKKLESVLTSITDGLAILDRDWRWTYFSDQGGNMLGLRPEEVVGRTVGETFPSIFTTQFGVRYQRAMETGEAQHFEEFYPAPLNRWIEVHCYPADKELSIYFRDITDRKLAEWAVQQSEERLRLAAQAAKFGTFDANLVDGTRYWSPEMRQLLGFPMDAPVGGPMVTPDFVHPEDRKHVTAVLNRAIDPAGDGVLEDEHRIVKPDGSVRWMQLRGRVQFEGVGSQRRPVRYSGTILDVTDRHTAELAMRVSEERFRKLFESDLLGIGTPHVGGGFGDVNEEFLRIVGYTREDFREGLVRWDGMTPPEFNELDRLHIEEALGRGSCTPYEKQYIRKDGSRVPILCGYAVLEQMPEYFIGFIQDLTVQKRAEAALREREERFSVLAESLPSLIFVTENGGESSYVNRRFLDYAGVEAHEMERIRWEKLIHPDDLQGTIDAWRHCMASGEAFLMEHRLRRQDGAYRWFLSRAMPERDERGQLVRWFGSATEVHEQKLAEEALRRSDKLAAMGRLAASVAHEINNPLTSVTNALYLARTDTTLSEVTRGFLELADQELTRVAQVATQTLRFYKQSTAPALVDVGQIVEQVVTVFSAKLRGLSVEVNRDYRPGTGLHCFGDELRQVFANLLSNSLDAMPEGGRLRIRVRQAVSWKDGSRGVAVLVGDTGTGIPGAVVQQIFEPFISTKADTGTGLGLWVSEGIVRKHGGKIRVRSSCEARNHGTVFWIFLPEDGISMDSRVVPGI